MKHCSTSSSPSAASANMLSKVPAATAVASPLPAINAPKIVAYPSIPPNLALNFQPKKSPLISTKCAAIPLPGMTAKPQLDARLSPSADIKDVAGKSAERSCGQLLLPNKGDVRSA